MIDSDRPGNVTQLHCLNCDTHFQKESPDTINMEYLCPECKTVVAE